MNENDVIRTARRHIEGQFPRDCSNCGRRFGSLRAYLQATTHLGDPISYDVESGDWDPSKPLGTLAFANCPCGTTLAVSSRGMPPAQMSELLSWAKGETETRGIEMHELLRHIRDEIDKRVLATQEPPADSEPGPSTGPSGVR